MVVIQILRLRLSTDNGGAHGATRRKMRQNSFVFSLSFTLLQYIYSTVDASDPNCD